MPGKVKKIVGPERPGGNKAGKQTKYKEVLSNEDILSTATESEFQAERSV